MGANEISTIIISGSYLKPGGIYCVSRRLRPFTEVLIKGTVFNPDNSPSAGACVEVIELNFTKITLGYVFTNKNGNFGFTVNYRPNVDYMLKFYSPLPNDNP